MRASWRCAAIQWLFNCCPAPRSNPATSSTWSTTSTTPKPAEAASRWPSTNESGRPRPARTPHQRNPRPPAAVVRGHPPRPLRHPRRHLLLHRHPATRPAAHHRLRPRPRTPPLPGHLSGHRALPHRGPPRSRTMAQHLPPARRPSRSRTARRPRRTPPRVGAPRLCPPAGRHRTRHHRRSRQRTHPAHRLDAPAQPQQPLMNHALLRVQDGATLAPGWN